MSLRQLGWVVASCVVATASLATAAPKDKDKKKTPVAPAKDTSASPTSPTTPSDTTPPPADEPPPKDMNGTDENPDRPHAVGMEEPPPVVVAAKTVRTGYPIEEALRPITLLKNMTEVSLDPHAAVDPFLSSATLRARYGITNKVQIGLAYGIGGIFDDPTTQAKDNGFRAGKTVGLDLTVMLQDWIGIRVGVPVYIDPLAVSITLGVPMKFTFADKFALGGLDDLLSIAVDKFPPSFYQEGYNAAAANDETTNTTQSRGDVRFSFYGIYQHQADVAIIGRIGFDIDDFSANRNNVGHGGITTFIRAGVQFTPRKFVDLGASLGFDDLAHGGSFDPQLYIAIRI